MIESLCPDFVMFDVFIFNNMVESDNYPLIFSVVQVVNYEAKVVKNDLGRDSDIAKFMSKTRTTKSEEADARPRPKLTPEQIKEIESRDMDAEAAKYAAERAERKRKGLTLEDTIKLDEPISVKAKISTNSKSKRSRKGKKIDKSKTSINVDLNKGKAETTVTTEPASNAYTTYTVNLLDTKQGDSVQVESETGGWQDSAAIEGSSRKAVDDIKLTRPAQIKEYKPIFSEKDDNISRLSNKQLAIINSDEYKEYLAIVADIEENDEQVLPVTNIGSHVYKYNKKDECYYIYNRDGINVSRVVARVRA